MTARSSRRWRLWAPVGLYMAFIFTMSSLQRPPDAPSILGDKGVHALLYFGLGALFVRALAGGWTTPMTMQTGVAAVVYSTLYGVSDEIHQMWVPPRAAEASDVAADAIGSLAAAVILYSWRRVHPAVPADPGRSAREAAAGRSSGREG